jgi:hypothetical protein
MKKIITILTISLILTSCACDTPNGGDVVTSDSTKGMNLSDTSVFTAPSVTETFIGDCVEGTTVTE